MLCVYEIFQKIFFFCFCYRFLFFFSFWFCSIHIKLHVPQLIKKHTHTRTIFKHHFVKPKSPKSFSHPPMLGSISASPSSLKLGSSAHLLKSFNDPDMALALSGKNLWRPSASEYRASELNYIPKKMKVPKKKNPFKVLEAMAEAHGKIWNYRNKQLEKWNFFKILFYFSSSRGTWTSIAHRKEIETNRFIRRRW